MRIEINLRAGQARPLAVPGERRRQDVMAGRPKLVLDPAPAPTADKRAMNENERRYRSLRYPVTYRSLATTGR
jgi:hypothetical protein